MIRSYNIVTTTEFSKKIIVRILKEYNAAYGQVTVAEFTSHYETIKHEESVCKGNFVAPIHLFAELLCIWEYIFMYTSEFHLGLSLGGETL